MHMGGVARRLKRRQRDLRKWNIKIETIYVLFW